jgi:hypothetical protein
LENAGGFGLEEEVPGNPEVSQYTALAKKLNLGFDDCLYLSER